jgi:hypothetical protein
VTCTRSLSSRGTVPRRRILGTSIPRLLIELTLLNSSPLLCSILRRWTLLNPRDLSSPWLGHWSLPLSTFPGSWRYQLSSVATAFEPLSPAVACCDGLILQLSE